MIEVTIDSDTVYADTPEDAVFAAKHVAREQVEHRGVYGHDPKIRFIVDGQTIRETTLRGLTR